MIEIKDVETFEEFQAQALNKSIYDWFYDEGGNYTKVQFHYIQLAVQGKGWQALVLVKNEVIISIQPFA